MSRRFWIWSVLVLVGALFLPDVCRNMVWFDMRPAPRLFAGLYFAWLLSPTLYLGPLLSHKISRRTRWALIALLTVHVLLFVVLSFYAFVTFIAART